MLLEDRLRDVEDSWFPDRESLRNLVYLRTIPSIKPGFFQIGAHYSEDSYGPAMRIKRNGFFMEVSGSLANHPGGDLLVMLGSRFLIDTHLIFGHDGNYKDYIWDFGILAGLGDQWNIGIRANQGQTDGDLDESIQVRFGYLW